MRNTPSIFSMKSALALATGLLIVSSQAAFADEEFYGRVESRPEGNAGIWTISGHKYR